jgi:CubicO group peptidase (beta-lactamase class C family)
LPRRSAKREGGLPRRSAKREGGLPRRSAKREGGGMLSPFSRLPSRGVAMRKLTLSAVAAIAAVVASVSASNPLATRQAGSAGIDALLKAAVDQKQVPFAVAMVVDGRGIVYEGAHGVKKDAIFAIASMTKPLTSVAAMQLVEGGKVRLNEPAGKYVPELSSVRVLDNGSLRPPKSPLLVRHLFTHTSGFGYEFMSKQLLDLVAKKQLPSVMAGDDGFLRAPLLFDPGTQWQYGISTDWLGRLVERVSGRSLEAYFRERIFTPLGMPDTFFDVPQDKRSRLAPRFQRRADGGLDEQPPQPAKPSQFFSGGGGLSSTAADYARFVRAMLAGGQLEGRRILSPQSVAEMRKNQIGELTLRPFTSVLPQLAVDGATLPGGLDKFGLGFALNSRTADTPRGAYTMSWAGIYNTFFWIDTEKQIGAVLMTQMLPGLDAGPRKLLEDFDAAVYAMKKTGKS